MSPGLDVAGGHWPPAPPDASHVCICSQRSRQASAGLIGRSIYLTTAKEIVIPKPRKPDYSKVWAYRVICLLDVISKLVERMAGHLITDHLERKKGLHEEQYGCRKRRSCIDAVVVLMN